MKSRNENGFTLMELMIILVIIGILGAITVPNMSKVLSRNKVRGSTSSVTSALYIARIKAINDGEKYGVEFLGDGSFHVTRDPYNVNEIIGTPYQLNDGVSFGDINFINLQAVFNEFGQLDKNCLFEGETIGTVKITDGSADSTMVEVTLISGRIKETSQ